MEEIPQQIPTLNPWLSRHGTGTIKAIFISVWQIIFRPKTFFSSLSEDHPVGDAFKFYFVFIITELIVVGGLFAASSPRMVMQVAQSLFVLPSLLIEVIVIAAVFIGVSIGLFIISAIIHLFVLLFRGQGGYGGTFSVVSYTSAAQALFVFVLPILFLLMKSFVAQALIFIIGAVVYFLIGIIWSCAIQVIGYKYIHKVDYIRAICIFLAPTILATLLNIGPMAGYVKKFEKTGAAFNKFKPNIAMLMQEKIVLTNPAGSIIWGSNLNSALKEAAVGKTIVMADFYTDWCGWCKKLDKDTYSDGRVRAVAKNFVSVKIDGDKSTDLVRKYNINGYPTIMFLRPDGSEEKRIVGYVDAGRLIATMNDIIKKNGISFDATPKAPPAGAGAPVAGKGGAGLLGGKLRFSGIAYSKGGVKAIINDEFVKVGDTVGGLTIIDISRDSVTLQDKAGKKTVLNQQGT